ncbi:MAG: helix-turn-helix transcriptional regulator [Halosimplex sp.]
MSASDQRAGITPNDRPEASGTAREGALEDLVDLLGRRSTLLDRLAAGSSEKRELLEAGDLPRSTLDRAIRELEAAGLVAYDDGAYVLTPLGERLRYEYRNFTERADRAVELEPFLRWTSPETFDLDLRWLTDARVWTAEPADPWAMVNRHVAALEAADRVRGVLPLVGLHAVETVRDRVVEDGADVELVVEASVAETLQSGRYAPLYRELQDREDPVFSVYPNGSVPFFVGVFDGAFVQVGVDEDREPRALLESDDERVLAWAREALTEYRRAAVPAPELDERDE